MNSGYENRRIIRSVIVVIVVIVVLVVRKTKVEMDGNVMKKKMVMVLMTLGEMCYRLW